MVEHHTAEAGCANEENTQEKGGEPDEKADVAGGSETSSQSSERKPLPSRPQEDNREHEDIPPTPIIDGGTPDLTIVKEFITGEKSENKSRQFFEKEWEAFNNERQTTFYEKEVCPTNLDFKAIREEWGYRPDNAAHWKNQKKKMNESDTFPPLFYSIVNSLPFILLQNAPNLIGILAANDYLTGQWYVKSKHEVDPMVKHQCAVPPESAEVQCCRYIGKCLECFETDPLPGVFTLISTLILGVLFSLNVYAKFVSYMRENTPDRFPGLVIVLAPAAVLCGIFFPLQVMVVSVIASFNTQVCFINVKI